MERTLHQQLKHLYADDESNTEVTIGSFRIDAIRDDELIEIQCASLSAIKDKTRRLLTRHKLRIVKPVIARKRISKVTEPGASPTSSRMSPKRGSVLDVFEELIYFTKIFPHPNLVIEVPLLQVEEFRAPPGKRRSRRQRWKKKFQVADVNLVSIDETHEFRTSNDLVKLLGWKRKPKRFNTADLATVIDRPRWVAQQIAYVLRNINAIKQIERKREGIVYGFTTKRRSPKKRNAA